MQKPDGESLLSIRWVYIVLVAYVAGFLLFPPRVLVIGDEERYVSQAVAFSRAARNLPDAEILYPAEASMAGRVMSDFPPGTSLLQVPFVWLAGWRGAVLLSVISLIAATLITKKWLDDVGLNPAFAILIPGFFGALFFGRVAMSDVPSAAVIALTLWLLWRAEGRGWGWSFGAGLSAGLSLLFREPIAVLLAPLMIDAIVRQRAVVWALVIGGTCGIAVRLGLSQLLFSSAFYVRDSGYGFSLSSVSHSVTPFGVILLLMFPLAALLPFFYTGPRRAAVQVSVGLYFLVFLLYEYDSIRENGPLKGLILASRFAVPALPLLVLMAADVFPRWQARLSGRWRQLTPTGLTIVAAGIALLAFTIHPAAQRQEAVPLSIVSAVYGHTKAETPIITNNKATLKYLSPVYGARKLILRSAADSAQVSRFQHAYGTLSVVLLDRADSDMFVSDARENGSFLDRLSRQCSVKGRYDERHASWARLRIVEITNCV